MNKSDYDKYYKKGGTYVIPVEVFNELFDELERLSFNYEQALEDLDKKDNIINELEKFVKNCNEYNSKCNSTIYEARAFEDSVILYKIKELKGSNNNE